MAGRCKLPALALTPGQRVILETLSGSRAAPVREVERARILLHYHAGKNPSAIQKALKISRVTIYHCLHKALAMGMEAGLKDAFHRPKEPVIGIADKAWVVHLACTKPKDLGYAAELWTRKSLAVHVRQQASAAGHASLARAAKSTVQRILDEQHLQPHKVKYYLERRDPEFELKMKEVLLVYREVMLQNQAPPPPGEEPAIITVSIDEKPGVQAIENTAPDLPRWRKSIRRWAGTMNTNGTELFRSWLRWICMTGMWSRESKSATAAGSLWPCLRNWTPITLPI